MKPSKTNGLIDVGIDPLYHNAVPVKPETPNGARMNITTIGRYSTMATATDLVNVLVKDLEAEKKRIAEANAEARHYEAQVTFLYQMIRSGLTQAMSTTHNGAAVVEVVPEECLVPRQVLGVPLTVNEAAVHIKLGRKTVVLRSSFGFENGEIFVRPDHSKIYLRQEVSTGTWAIGKAAPLMTLLTNQQDFPIGFLMTLYKEQH